MLLLKYDQRRKENEMIVCDYCNSQCRLDKNLHCMNCGAPMLPGFHKPIIAITSKELITKQEAKRIMKMWKKRFKYHNLLLLGPGMSVRLLKE